MINELVFVGHDGQAVTNSVKVAEKFGKEHKHVLESIRKLMTAENSAVLQMFEERAEGRCQACNGGTDGNVLRSLADRRRAGEYVRNVH